MPTALQNQLRALLAEFTSSVLEALRDATLTDLISTVPAAPPPRREVVPPPREAAPVASTPARSPKKAAAPARTPIRARASSDRRRPSKLTPEQSAKQLDETILRHLRGGVLLTMDDVVALGASEGDAPLVQAAVDRLVARGLVGVLGEGPARFVFASKGRPSPSAGAPNLPKASKPEAAPVVAAETVAVPAEEPPAAASAPPVSAVPAEPAAGDAKHPFVVRRKKTVSAT